MTTPPRAYALAMVDWVVVSSLATAGGTLVIAIATFVSVRSANRAARTAERALQVGMRPLLSASRLTDPDLKMSWVDEHHARVGGGRASIELADDRIYLAMSLRNVGSGVAVMQSWTVDLRRRIEEADFGDPEGFRRQSRDLYIATGDVGFWQAAVRDPDDPLYAELRTTIEERRRFLIDLLYTNDEGDQRAITRFVITPPTDEGTQWFCSVGRHTYLDRPNPR
jgi:hypothetical protein